MITGEFNVVLQHPTVGFIAIEFVTYEIIPPPNRARMLNIMQHSLKESTQTISWFVLFFCCF